MISILKKIWRKIASSKILSITFYPVVVVSFCIIGGIILLHILGIPISDSFWMIITIIVSQQLDVNFPLTTPLGKVTAFITLVVGLGVISAVISIFTSRAVVKKLKEDRGFMKTTSIGHIVICGWNNNAEKVIKELRAEKALKKKPIVLIAKNLEEKPIDDNFLHFIKGDPTDEDTLAKANVKQADTAVILADTSEGVSKETVDARTILTTLAIETINRDVYTCAEILDQKNTQHLKHAHVDEIILSSDYSGNLLAHAAKNHGISEVITELLTTNFGNEFYKIKVPSNLVGKDFRDASEAIYKEHRSILLAALEPEKKPVVNPLDKFKLKKCMELVVISRDRPDV